MKPTHTFFALTMAIISSSLLTFAEDPAPPTQNIGYEWTPDHMHVGVRWQPFTGRPGNNAYDAKRPVIAEDSSYVQFWTSWSAMEPSPKNTDYTNHPSSGLQTIEQAVDACNAMGKKIEFVFFHCPAWASVSGESGGHRPKDGLFEQFATRMATHFKGRVDAWQLSHEANLQGLMLDADMNFMIHEVLLGGAQAIKAVYQAEPVSPVILSTTGCSPCNGCDTREGLASKGGKGVSQFYDQLIANPALMDTVDALNMNVSDQNNGYGKMDLWYVPSVWGNYDLVRKKLDSAGYHSKKILSSESWISWDDGASAVDVNNDGVKNEIDAYIKTITILGKCLERGLNTINLPWSDNSSGWAMGLTKRRDYNGRIKTLRPDLVTPAHDGGPDIVTQKVILRGDEDSFTILEGSGNVFTKEDYINPGDPNHLHYYIWRWFAQIAGGSDEVIRHAIAAEKNNDITVKGAAYTGKERYRISSYNRTRDRFTVLVYASGAKGNKSARVTLPAKIKTGKYYNNESSRHDYRDEGFADGETYFARIVTKDISMEHGGDIHPVESESVDAIVTDEMLTVDIPNMKPFTTIEFIRRPQKAPITIIGPDLPEQQEVIPPALPDREGPGLENFFEFAGDVPSYEASRNHVHVGFRWQPYPDRPKNSEHDISLEMGQVGSYASFWYMSLHTLPTKESLDYANSASKEALAIRHAVRLCKARGIQTELVLWQVPLWMNGGSTYADFKKMPEDPQQIYDMVKATVEWFGEDVDYYALFHEANHPKYWEGSDAELLEYFVLPAARAIRDYSVETGDKKVVSTAGLSPSRNCKKWYDIQLKSDELMGLIDNFALNLSDFSNGWGGGRITWVSSCWDQLDYMRKRLDEEGHSDKGLAAAESWICWDGERTPHGPEASGDTVESTLRIFGECLQRGLSLANLPWADNNSTWSMGLTKRLDYNGALAELGEELYPNFRGGAAIAARKLNVMGSDDKTQINNDNDSFAKAKFGAPYAVPDDPNHTHYYIWRWFAQLSAGRNECVHHAIAGETGNDIVITGADADTVLTASSYDRTAQRFIVLIARREVDGAPLDLKIEIPAQIQKGARYHQDDTFVGEGLAEGQRYTIRWTSEGIDPTTGYRRDKIKGESVDQIVDQQTLTATIPESRRLTTLVFEPQP